MTLESMLARNQILPDLAARVAAFVIPLPPLRERKADLAMLTQRALEDIAVAHRLPAVPYLHATVQRLFARYEWPDNVRELKTTLERAVVEARGAREIRLRHFPLHLGVRRDSQERESYSRPTWSAVVRALEDTGGNVLHAARRVGMSRASLYRCFGDELAELRRTKRSHETPTDARRDSC